MPAGRVFRLVRAQYQQRDSLAESSIVDITGTLAETLDDATSAASGTYTPTPTVVLATLDANGTLAYATYPDATAGELLFNFITGSVGLVIATSDVAYGTLAQTLGDVTSAASGASGASGTLAVTLANLTSTAAGASVTGTTAATLANLTSAAAGASGASGTLAQTLGDLTSAASGTHSTSGSLAETLDNTTSAAAGSTVTGTLAVTLGNVTSAASGTFTPATVTGTVAVTLANLTSAASGSSVSGTVAQTLGTVTAVASGTYTPATVTGTLAQTLANLTSAASGASGAAGTLARTLGNTTSAASGSSVTGTVVRTLANVTASAAGTVGDTGTLDETLTDVTSAASGTHIQPINGTLDETLDNVTPTVSGAVGVFVPNDPSPAKCTMRRQRFSRKLHYHRTAQRPALSMWAFDIRNTLIDFSDTENTYLFRIGNPGDEAILEKTTNIYGAVGTGTPLSGTPNIRILWEPGELDIEPGTYACQFIATNTNLDAVFHGTLQILDVINT